MQQAISIFLFSLSIFFCHGTHVATLSGHKNEVVSLEWSVDGRCILSMARSIEFHDCVKLWECSKRLDGIETWSYIRLKKVYTTNRDKWVKTKNKKKIKITGLCAGFFAWNEKFYHDRIDPYKEYLENCYSMSYCDAVCLSNDNKYCLFVQAATGKHRNLIVIDSVGNKIWERSVDLYWRLSFAAWSPCNRYIALGGWHGSITLWDLKMNALIPLRKQGNKFDSIDYLAWSPDGTRLASAHGSNNDINIWNVDQGLSNQSFKQELLDNLLNKQYCKKIIFKKIQ